jgi:hypothetical protein
MSDEIKDVLALNEVLESELTQYKRAVALAESDGVVFEKYLQQAQSDPQPLSDRIYLLTALASRLSRLADKQRAVLENLTEDLRTQQTVTESLRAELQSLLNSPDAPSSGRQTL